MTVQVIKNFINDELCKEISLKSKDQVESNFGVAKGYRESFEQLPPIENISAEHALQHLSEYRLKETEENVFVFKSVCNIVYKIKKEIEQFYNINVTEVQNSLIKMLEGAKNELHSDMYLLDGTEWHGGIGERSSFKYSALLYFSTSGVDFEGGEIHFPDQNVSIKPTAGDLVFFTGDLEHKHYVSKITSGERLALVAFLKPESVDKINL